MFYANENFPRPVVKGLRRLGYDVLTVQEAGKTSCEDDDVFEFARKNARSVITNDKDFISIHTKDPHHFGILVCKLEDFNQMILNIKKVLCCQSNLINQLIHVP